MHMYSMPMMTSLTMKLPAEKKPRNCPVLPECTLYIKQKEGSLVSMGLFLRPEKLSNNSKKVVPMGWGFVQY